MQDMMQLCTFRAAFLAAVACKIMGCCFGSIDHTCNVSKLRCRTSASLMRLHSQRINEVISSDRLWAAEAHPDTFSLLRGLNAFFGELLGVADLPASWKERCKSRMVYWSFREEKLITHIQKQTHTLPRPQLNWSLESTHSPMLMYCIRVQSVYTLLSGSAIKFKRRAWHEVQGYACEVHVKEESTNQC